MSSQSERNGANGGKASEKAETHQVQNINDKDFRTGQQNTNR